MADFDKLTNRFWQFGGMRLVWQYAKMGVLWVGIREIIKCALSRKSFKEVYPVITNKVDDILIKELSPVLTQARQNNPEQATKQQAGDYIWFCWLQGMAQAPEMVKVCLESQKRMFGDKVIVLDNKNYKDWISLPDYVEEKYRKGYIPGALFSDMMRLELLIQYGGTWIDSTVLADPTGLNNSNNKWRPSIDEIKNSELFIFRYFRQGKIVGMSNWFIHSKPNNPLLQDIRDMLYAYWQKYNCTVEYYIFHLLFAEAAKRYPEMIVQMPKGNSFHSLMLRDNITMFYDEDWWQELTTHVCFHKLNYRLEKQANINQDSYWKHILTEMHGKQ